MGQIALLMMRQVLAAELRGATWESCSNSAPWPPLGRNPRPAQVTSAQIGAVAVAASVTPQSGRQAQPHSAQTEAVLISFGTLATAA